MNERWCCVIRDGIRLCAFYLCCAGGILLFMAAPFGILSLLFDRELFPTVVGATLFMAAFALVMAGASWLASALPRWHGRAKGCRICMFGDEGRRQWGLLREGSHPMPPAPTDPDRSGVRLRPAAPWDESDSA